jgi:hypothetical protein
MSEKTIVNSQTTLEDASVTEEGFGTLLVAGYVDWFDPGELVRTYEDPADVITDGATTSHPVYKAVAAAFAQNPAPSEVKVGKTSGATTQRVKITPTVANSTRYAMTVVSPAGVETEVEYTSDGSATMAEIIAGLIADLPADVTGTDQTTYLRVVADNAGEQWGFIDLTSNLGFEEDTAVVGTLGDDLTAILEADGDWFGLVLASKGTAEMNAASVWAESNDKMFCFASQNHDLLTSGSSDAFSVCSTAERVNTICRRFANVQEHGDAAFMGRWLPFIPGEETAEYKDLSGISTEKLTTTQRTNLEAKNGGSYETIKGEAVTLNTVVAAGEFADIIRTRYAIDAAIEERIFGLLRSKRKVPYTNSGIAMVKSCVWAVLQDFQERGALTSDVEMTVTAPDSTEVSGADKTARRLRNVQWTATLAGAIHFVDPVSGTLSF